jgi:D-arginine dehydrogenase
MKENSNLHGEASTVISADVAVLGAGFAGVTTALHLARRGSGRVVLLEKESVPGLHSSGRNAGMVRQVTSEETLSALARKGAAHIRSEAQAAGPVEGAKLFRPTGSLLVAGGPKAAQLELDISRALAAGVKVERLDRGEAVRRFGILKDASFEVGCFCATDGVVDLPALLDRYVRAAERAGVHVLLSARVSEVILERGRIRGVRAGALDVQAPLLVNAAGPWAQEIGRLAGAAPMPLSPRRRHIFVTRPLDWVPPDWPFIWDISTDVYFRPELGGLLLSPCDEAAPEPKDSRAVVPGAFEVLQKKLKAQFPSLVGLPRGNAWSGIRTLTPDGRFVVGPDPRLEGFFWVAGLGGHGVTASNAIGELAADLILHPKKNAANPHDPGRFAGEDARRKA